jgi:hypothetical protein
MRVKRVLTEVGAETASVELAVFEQFVRGGKAATTA